MKKIQRLSALSLTVAVAMLLSYIEAQLPAFTAVPGIKVGLANIAVIFALYRFGIKDAVVISIIRVAMISLLFGSVVSLAYGFSGAVVSLALMAVLKRFSPLTPIGVSVAGGVAHNIGQIAVACILVRSAAVAYYLPVLLISGTVAGIVTGVAAGILVKRLK